ncbi:hypothetical protein [Tessaracoccus antarcticus]|uniref:Uncharacterized protein n=1 Tax=Tessaracoccus antarcticus TaxID=2479848 RepID=A0A3M0G8G7_9ACTN|nr:hypothetical protein [Tessaracoccus antarcticus]RMB58712.1 hypothetical protein EAX62_11265 [Tessaracoccus antarcticus]
MNWLQRLSSKQPSAATEAEESVEQKHELPRADEQFEGMGSGARASAMRREGLALSPLDECDADEHDTEYVRGKHFLEWGDELKRLKREGRLDDALTLAMEIIEATERGQSTAARNASKRAAYLRGKPEDHQPRETPPGWTEHAAIILRKLGRFDEKVAVIDRWIAHAGPSHRWVGAKHAKLLERRGRAIELTGSGA